MNEHQKATALLHGCIKPINAPIVSSQAVINADVNNDGVVDDNDVKAVKAEAKRSKRSKKKKE